MLKKPGGKIGRAFAVSLVCSTAVCAAPALKYMPVPGGFATRNGDGEFNRPLYGWHGDDRELSPCKSLPWTSDRPKVALKVFRGYRIDNKVRGVLQFGDGTEDVEYRYVWGRAEYNLKDRGTVKMVRSAQSDGLLVEATGDLPPKFDGEWELAAKGERDGATYYDFERKGMRRPASIDPAAAFDAATNHFERIARTIKVKTPDPILDSLLPCQLLVADAMFEGRHITHGATNWKQAFAGWCVVNIASGVTMPTVLPNSGALFGTKSWSTIQRACHPHCRHDHNSPAIKDHRQ